MNKKTYISPTTEVLRHAGCQDVMLQMQFYTSSVYEHVVEVDYGGGGVTPGFGGSLGGW